jgi:CBS domain-containing protein
MTSIRQAIPDPEAPSPPAQPLYDQRVLDLDVRHVMSPGVITISDDATVGEAADAMELHRIHAILVVGGRSGTALGWVTTRGLLGFVGRDARTPVTDAITEQVTGIQPGASVHSAIYALSLPGVTRLLVRRRPLDAAEGVITDFDLAVKTRRPSLTYDN